MKQDLLLALKEIVITMQRRLFHAMDVMNALNTQNPILYNQISNQYGMGGSGNGNHYTAVSFVAQQLSRLAREGAILKIGYQPSPEGFGSPVIMYWSRIDEIDYPDVLQNPELYPEGAKKTVVVNHYERNTAARQACLQHYGLNCSVCSFNFEEKYGEHGQGFIHVHHIHPISEQSEEYNVDPVRDLRPVCPNCHSMLHRGKDILSIEELRKLLK
ncbi:HNH endonuclease [Novacetimonas hansenii]|uniref:HNH endonuclease n=1 Tax=Novacetimonas hansenii TaxID=436 RepID=UPI00094F6FD4|nr:HNH endonuclease [Novacetimonas hansenii]PYD71039.1 hypothetical protein CFR74_15185 [Novacetimonas hansenii]